jgi:hypothetical protein
VHLLLRCRLPFCFPFIFFHFFYFFLCASAVAALPVVPFVFLCRRTLFVFSYRVLVRFPIFLPCPLSRAHGLSLPPPNPPTTATPTAVSAYCVCDIFFLARIRAASLSYPLTASLPSLFSLLLWCLTHLYSVVRRPPWSSVVSRGACVLSVRVTLVSIQTSPPASCPPASHHTHTQLLSVSFFPHLPSLPPSLPPSLLPSSLPPSLLRTISMIASVTK